MTTSTKTSILILDDEPIVSKRLQPALEKMGYEVESFYDSSRAMARVLERSFDIVVTDLKMEGVDGMQFLAAVKDRSPKTEVIVITGFATMDTAKESMRKGVFDFLAKPFKLGEIQEVIRKAEAHVCGEDK
ncbi:response regulator [Pseudodesulfovibrio sp.]|uniref:response regulator n=1 Tax=Pseudodesulfovibrio sp. TaxID=2035812 RepID=UPI0026149873|nr:response regulator [Pseudodesulfovibrio sp.]MDD3311423.1 response regulator [Pseudodesulfovibrio sp.]